MVFLGFALFYSGDLKFRALDNSGVSGFRVEGGCPAHTVSARGDWGNGTVQFQVSGFKD